jgi:undecaprenyl-diphosphatase
MDWDKATDIILLASFAVLAVFVGLGIYQWVKRKSLKKVDNELLWAPLPLTLMALVYIVFDKFWVLNTRPDGSGEPSFPSTHVMVVGTIFCLIAGALPSYIHSRTLTAVIWILMAVLMTLCSIGRIVANKHTLVDVLGGLGFAILFAVIYAVTLKKLTKPKE